jgi:Rieske 2Fe-2S family protein
VIIHRFTPLAPDRTSVVCDWLFAADAVAGPGFDPTDSVELFHRVNEQDFAASEWCQPNMRSRAYRDGGVLVPLESTIIGDWYYPWYRAKMHLD